MPLNEGSEPKIRVAIIVLAAGTGTRFGNATNKVWLPLGNLRVVSHSLINASRSFEGCRVILVINPADETLAKEVIASEVPSLGVELVTGGLTRHDSEYNALLHLAPDIESGIINVIVIHDGARPLASHSLFEEIARTANNHGGALPAIEVNPLELEIVTERKVVRVQTPQAFRAMEVLSAYRQSLSDNFVGTDTAACMEKYFPETKSIAVKGEVQNIKITYPKDLVVAGQMLAQLKKRLQ